jgi:hypothetical protein
LAAWSGQQPPHDCTVGLLGPSVRPVLRRRARCRTRPRESTEGRGTWIISAT